MKSRTTYSEEKKKKRKRGEKREREREEEERKRKREREADRDWRGFLVAAPLWNAASSNTASDSTDSHIIRSASMLVSLDPFSSSHAVILTPFLLTSMPGVIVPPRSLPAAPAKPRLLNADATERPLRSRGETKSIMR